MTMEVTTLTLSCLLLLGVAWSADPEAPTQEELCCWPEKFENKLTSTTGQKFPGQDASLFMSVGNMHVDYSIGKIAVVQESSVMGKTTVIQHLKDEVMYLINPAAKSCMKLPLPDYMKGQTTRPCFPGAPAFTETLGSGEEILTVNMYEYKTATGFHTKVYNTQKQCFPVSQDLQSTYMGGDMLVSQTFSNVQIGIKDPSVFNLPGYCTKSDVGHTEEHSDKQQQL